MNSKRVYGRLLFVVALIGILSRHVMSSEVEPTAEMTVTTAPADSSDDTAVSATTVGGEGASAAETETPGGQETSETSTGTAPQSGGTSDVVAGTGGEEAPTTGGTTGGGETATSAVASGGGETATSAAASGAVETVSVLGSEGTGTAETQTVKSSAGVNEGDTSTISTGATSSAEAVGAIRINETTGTNEATTGSVKQLSETSAAASVGVDTATVGQSKTTKTTEEPTSSTPRQVQHRNVYGCEPKYASENECNIRVTGNSTSGVREWATNITYRPTEIKDNNYCENRCDYDVTYNISSVTVINESVDGAASVENGDKFNCKDVSSRLEAKLKKTTTSGTRRRRELSEEIVEIKNGVASVLKDLSKPKQQESKSAGLGLPVIILCIVLFISAWVVVLVACGLHKRWRGRGLNKRQDKIPIRMEEAREAPTAVSNPIPDAEMIQDEAPMQERENPAVTPNGGGQHISKADEDNGWVVPLDELSKAEQEKPEVENTRL